MPIFKKDEEENNSNKPKKKKKKLFQTKSGRWVTPQDRKEHTIKGADDEDVDGEVQETVSQIDLDIPGMVVLTSKQDRHIGRLNQDMRAKEEFKKETRSVLKPPPALPDVPGDFIPQTPASTVDPGLLESGQIILDKLLEVEKITDEQKEAILSLSAKKGIMIEEAVCEAQVLTAHDLGTFIAGMCKIPFSNLEVLRVSPKARDILTLEQMMQSKVIPLSKIGPTLNITAVNPLNNQMIEQLKTDSGFEVKCIVCTPATFTKTIQSFNG